MFTHGICINFQHPLRLETKQSHFFFFSGSYLLSASHPMRMIRLLSVQVSSNTPGRADHLMLSSSDISSLKIVSPFTSPCEKSNPRPSAVLILFRHCTKQTNAQRGTLLLQCLTNLIKRVRLALRWRILN